MATAKKPITRSTDPNVRKSPPLSASQFPAGHVAKGNDGNYWIINESANGIKRWVPSTKTASKSSSTKSSTSQTASSSPTVETQQEVLDRFNTYLNNTLDIYYTLPKTNIIVYKDDKLNIISFQALIGNNIVVDENDPDFKKQLMDWLSQRSVIKNPKILSDSRADITDFTFEFDPNASSFETRDELNLLDDFLYIKMNVRNGKQLPDLTQSSSSGSSDKNTLEDWQKSIKSKGVLYYDLPKSDVKIYQFLTSNVKSYQFVIELHPSQDVDIVLKYLKEKLDSLASIDISTIVNPIGNILLVTFTFDEDMGTTTKMKELDILDNYLFGTIGVKPSTSSTETAVQQVETKVDDIVFSSPVVPVGTEDQRNATDKLVDEFIAKNENNLKKLAVENVGLLSTIDKTLEFIKAKFGTPATISSVSNVVSTASQTQPIGGIDDYKLIKFIGEDGERQVIEFKKFKTGQNANVFKYLIGDVFLDTTSSNPDADFVYKQIIGAQEGGVNAGYIHYIDSYPGKVGIGLTWDSRVKKISVGDFEGKIETGEWTSVPGANANLKLLNSQTQASSSSQTVKKGRFSLGDRVKISRSSQYYGINASNPKNEEGEIIDIAKGSTHPIKVKWANGKSNTYPTKDLVLVTSVQSSTQASTQAPAVTPTAGGSSVANVGDTVTFYASREKTNLTGVVKAIVTGTDGKPYLRINVNGKFYLKQQGSVTKVK
jgi:hypothetical protein